MKCALTHNLAAQWAAKLGLKVYGTDYDRYKLPLWHRLGPPTCAWQILSWENKKASDTNLVVEWSGSVNAAGSGGVLFATIKNLPPENDHCPTTIADPPETWPVYTATKTVKPHEGCPFIRKVNPVTGEIICRTCHPVTVNPTGCHAETNTGDTVCRIGQVSATLSCCNGQNITGSTSACHMSWQAYNFATATSVAASSTCGETVPTVCFKTRYCSYVSDAYGTSMCDQPTGYPVDGAKADKFIDCSSTF
jgi:hypothetical protein